MQAKTMWRALVAVPLALLTYGVLHAQSRVARSADFPLLHRAAGSRLAARDVRENHTCDLPVGPVRGNRFSSTKEFHGRATSITYDQRQGRSIGDVYRELEKQLLDSGMQVLFQCKDGNCGSGTGPANFCTPAWRGSNGQRQLTGTLLGTDGFTVVSLHVQAPENRERAVAHLTVVEVSNPTGTGLGAGIRPGTPGVSFSTATLLSRGKVELPEPLFQPKSAKLRTEADRTLADIGQFLKQNPGVRVIVINASRSGSGWLQDLILSRDRGLAITSALTAHYGIAANRVKAQTARTANWDAVNGDSQTQLVLDR